MSEQNVASHKRKCAGLPFDLIMLIRRPVNASCQTVKSSKSPRDEGSAIEEDVRRVGATHCTRAAIPFVSVVQGSVIPLAQTRHRNPTNSSKTDLDFDISSPFAPTNPPSMILPTRAPHKQEFLSVSHDTALAPHPVQHLRPHEHGHHYHG